MRAAFQNQLALLTDTLAEMCQQAGEAMQHATQALLDADLDAAELVITEHDRLVRRRASAEETTFALLALQAPVAGDLRAVVVAMQTAADVERMGGLATHIAKIARRRHPQPVLPADVTGHFAEMGRVAVELGESARHAILSGDPGEAARIQDQDDAMDELHRRLFTVLLDPGWPHGIATAVDITLLGRFYERFADHAVVVGRRIVFQATGRTPTA